ncbi:MAG: cyclase family protein [Chloroflexota bacterium]
MKAPRRLHDISRELGPRTPVFPGDPPPRVRQALSRAAGDPVNLSELTTGVHCGTHVDAPYHVDEAWPPLGEEHLSALVGAARVVGLSSRGPIGVADLARLPWDGVERVLFQGAGPGSSGDGCWLELEAARFLVEHTPVRLVGVDSLSIEDTASADLAVHRLLLGRGVLVLEGLDLTRVLPGEYYLLCLPLRLAAPDGAPARAVLLEF